MNSYPNAAAGLKMIFTGEILLVLSIVVTLFAPIVGIIMALVCLVLNFMGIQRASKDDEGLNKAYAYTIADFIVSLIQIFFDKEDFFYSILDMASSVLQLMILYYICKSSAKLLRNIGANDIAASGDKVWTLNKNCVIISLVCAVLLFIPLINILAVLIMIVVAIVTIYAAILYLIFLNNAYKALGA